MNQDIEPTVFPGNVAVHKHPQDQIQFGDGSLEVEGKLYVNEITPYTTGGVTKINDTIFDGKRLQLTVESTAPTNAPTGKLILYVDPTLKRLRQVDETGKRTALLTNKGDLISHDGTIETLLPLGATGTSLTVDPTSATGLAWKVPASFTTAAQYMYVSNVNESNTNATIFITKLSLSVTVTQPTMVRVGISFQWRMPSFDQFFRARLIRNDVDVLLECSEFSSGVGSNQTNIPQHLRTGFVLVQLTAGTHTFKLQWCLQDSRYTAFISNAHMELWQL